jgi:hypothetical protein
MKHHDCECGRRDCSVCSEAAALAALVREDYERAQQHAPLPTAEIVWWRAQMRARQEAARAAARPIVFTQALAAAALIGLLVSLAGRFSLQVSTWNWARFSTLPSEIPIIPVVLGLGCWLVLAPVALYLALSRD